MTELDDSRPYFYRLRGNALGPFDLEAMQQKVQRGIISRTSEISRDGSDWRKATDSPELFHKPMPLTQVERETSPPVIDSVTPGADSWYIVLHGVQQPDPVSLATVQQYVDCGLIKKDDVVCKQGDRNWSIVRSIPELAMFVRMEEPKPVQESSNGLAIAGFVLSLLGCTAPLGFIFSLVALNGRNQANRGLAIAGAILGGIATLGFVLWLVWMVLIFNAASGSRF
jgi:hypothetical protein